MNRFTFVNLTVGQARTVEGLQVPDDPDRPVGSDARILGASKSVNHTEAGMDGLSSFEDWSGAMERMVARCRDRRLTEAEAREVCLKAMRLSYASSPGTCPVPLEDYLTFIGLLFEEVW